MADILIATHPTRGHFLPLRPIATELVARGHHVRWLTGPDFAGTVTATGARFHPLGGGGPEAENAERAALKSRDKILWDMKHLFLEPAPGQVAAIRAMLAEEPADVVVADVAFTGARMVHELGGPPWVSVGVTPLTLPSRDLPPFGPGLHPDRTVKGRVRDSVLRFAVRTAMRDVERFHDDVRGRVGLGPSTLGLLASGVSPFLHLQAGVAGLEYPRSDLPAQVHFVGALTAPSADPPVLPWWSEVETARVPIVHVTQGTFANADVETLLAPALRALAGEEVLVVATLGGRATDPDLDLALPANARVASYLPYDRLLPRTAAIVTNGGFGGVNEALAHGVPLVVAGGTEDKPEVAARVAWSGAGLDLRTGTPSEKQIRAAVRSVLGEESYRARAAAVAAEFGRAPSPADLVEDLLSRATSPGGRGASTGRPRR